MDGHERIEVVAEDGSYVGRLRHVAAEPGSGRASGLVLERNGFAVMVPLRAVIEAPRNRVVLAGTADDYSDLPPFDRAGYRLLDHEFERQEVQLLMEQQGIEDFEIGSDDDEATPVKREAHTGAENPYRVPIQEQGRHPAPIADDPTDMDRGVEA
ncbi:MAG: PRC-barrel domain-containing protein [Dehalococcoidia bacterium]|nr:PRC-barrel domain-containing protein [Dehalococcoidia bacterium]